jgi:methanogenic corrinoid protein MtbC1
MSRLMILPSSDSSAIRLLRVPEDYEIHEVYRHATGVIAAVESDNPDYAWEDIAEALEEEGYEVLDFILGPALD